jgi:hypothetical protein
MRKSGKANGWSIWNFTMPAFKEASGRRICPGAGTCAKFCYAQKGAYRFGNVSRKHQQNYEATLRDDFVARMVVEIKRKRGKVAIRIHDSSDFYDVKYLSKWIDIMQQLPDVKFYAYSKSLLFFEKIDMPNNFTLIKSEGGIFDYKIKPDSDRHARIFESRQALLDADYDDASDDDSVAFESQSGKIGLVFH